MKIIGSTQSKGIQLILSTKKGTIDVLGAKSKPNQEQPVSCPQNKSPLGQTHHHRCCSAAKTINDPLLLLSIKAETVSPLSETQFDLGSTDFFD